MPEEVAGKEEGQTRPICSTFLTGRVELCFRVYLSWHTFKFHNLSLQGGSCTEDDAAALQLPFIHHLLKKVNDHSLSAEEVEEIYTVLSVMPWRLGRSSSQLGALCEALWSARDGPLKEERILSSLLRPQCDALVDAYCTTALRLQRDQLLTSSPQLQGRGPLSYLCQ